jgi:hypothetical protein
MRVIKVLIVVTRFVVWLFRTIEFDNVLTDHRVLNHVPTSLIDRVRDVCVHLVRAAAPFDFANVLRTAKPRATLVAIAAAKMILVTALSTACRHLSAGHGNKRSVHPFNDLQVANDKRMIDGDGTESSKTILGLFHQFDANLGDFHGVECTPLFSEPSRLTALFGFFGPALRFLMTATTLRNMLASLRFPATH